MSRWTPALIAAVAAKGPDKRPTPSMLLSAIALDAEDVTVEDVMTGVTIVYATSAHMREALGSVVRAVLCESPRLDIETMRQPWEPAEAPQGGVLVVQNCKRDPNWHFAASDAGAAVVVIVSDAADVYPAHALVTCDRTVELHEDFLPDDVQALIALVTGEHVDLDGHWPRLLFSDVISCVSRGSTAVQCAERLWRLVDSMRRADEAAADDAADMQRRLDEPETLGHAASGVVRRLSEMTGFGDAGRWGIQTAADIRAYASGALAWSEVDRGILLAGPPGSGKTTFSLALALEAGVDLVTTTYNEWHGTGGGDNVAKNLTKLFDGWRKKATNGPFILLLDEIDSLGVRGNNGTNDSWWGSIINAWLAFLDGAVPRNGIVVVGATNHVRNVDPALLRPGRLDRVVELPYPDPAAMQGVVRHHLGPDADIDEAELARAARACRGMSPALVEMTCREARRMARTMFRRRVCADDVSLVLGARRLAAMQVPGAREIDRRIAVHEAAHAIAALGTGELLHVDLDRCVTATLQPTMLSLAYIEARMTLLLAGMAAEHLILGSHTSGNQVDLQEATRLAASAHASWAMGEEMRTVPPTSRSPTSASSRPSRRYSGRHTSERVRWSRRAGMR